MRKRTIFLCLIALIAAAGALSGSAYGADWGSVGRFGKSVGRKSSDSLWKTGCFFKKFGKKVSCGSEKLFKQQGRFWSKFGKSFADFKD